MTPEQAVVELNKLVAEVRAKAGDDLPRFFTLLAAEEERWKPLFAALEEGSE